MVVYIESVIVDNLIFTALICCISYWIMRERIKKLRTFAASLIGTICAVGYPFVKNDFAVIGFKVALFFVMCAVLYIKGPKPILHSASFLLSTAMVGGAQFMAGFIYFGNASIALRVPISNIPLGLFLLVPAVVFFAVKKLFGKINAHRLKRNYIYDIKLTIGDKEAKLKALIDTGNSVKAERDVMFISKLTAIDILQSDYISLIDRSPSITVHTAAGDKKIILLSGKIELYLSEDEHIFMDVQVGIGDIRKGEYEAILPLNILNKERVQ